jgi:hypothetical protein
VCNTRFVSIVYRSQVTSVFSLVINGGSSISTARRHNEPEVTSPIDSLTTVSYGKMKKTM